MTDLSLNDVATFKDWCNENGFDDVFAEQHPNTQKRFEKAMIAFHEARMKAHAHLREEVIPEHELFDSLP